jgi:predicted SnoaL-like aldol condensation-catalyzing enzyme
MKTLERFVLSAALAVTMAGPTLAADDNLIGLNQPNGKLAYDFITMWFNEHKPREAFDKYVSKTDYMNHTVYNATASDHKTFEEEKEAEAKIVPPNARFDIQQIIAQGPLVFIHIHAFGQPKDPQGDELVEILRIENGKIVDHWDMWTAMKPDSAVFVGLHRFDSKQKN